MDIKNIKRLVELVENADISHLSIEEDGTKIKIKKELGGPIVPSPIPLPNSQVATSIAPNESVSVVSETPVSEAHGLTPITSQMVGTFYASPNPESPPFVKPGDTISNGQTLCIIEAMKLFNEIESEVEGIVEKVCVSNGDPIEFGQTLFLIK
jgi:acetyl-CoA carboxylase biotin carboxyl carrier protein